MTSPHPAAASPVAWANSAVAADTAAGLLRRPRQRQDGSDLHCHVDGRAVVVFSSNDYLGLATHPSVREAAAAAAMALGVGATGSRHLSGGHAAMAALEAELARFLGTETATLAPTGYAANVAVLEALGGPDATILSDAANHASLIDGCRASRSMVQVYRHLDAGDLEVRLRGVSGRPVIVTDSVFSMDGGHADLGALDGLARRFGAWLVVDEAHALGTTGPGGRGLTAELGLEGEHLVRVVTLSKALGAAGGAICAPAVVRQLLLQRGRALIFSTALPHPVVAGAAAALRALVADPGLVERLRENAARLRRHLGGLAYPGGDPASPIVAVMTGEAEETMRLDAALWESGYLVQGLRPPTVPAGECRLRLVASAAHTPGEIEGVSRALLALLG
jgi:8-amino-7-oxononanoate synthase